MRNKRKAQKTRSWAVYGPDYQAGGEFIHVPFLKDAWNKACALGSGSMVIGQLYKINNHGQWTDCWNDISYEVPE